MTPPTVPASCPQAPATTGEYRTSISLNLTILYAARQKHITCWLPMCTLTFAGTVLSVDRGRNSGICEAARLNPVTVEPVRFDEYGWKQSREHLISQTLDNKLS